MGLPESWVVVHDWLRKIPVWSISSMETPSIMLKFPEIPKLDSYEDIPPKSFWKSFPSCPLTEEVKSSIDVERLSVLVESQKLLLLDSELLRARKCIKNFKVGASSHQKTDLPSCYCKNTNSCIVHGQVITDTIASWIVKGFVCGPFEEPPLKNFRCNSLMAVDQGDKIRPVLNVSSPVNFSFNDNVNLFKLEK